ncbi:tRNA lysidine(34) synthetase TilS [Helicobacter sp. 16-1353]|uniref:tRNA lysidine(34) synthetase TilS n=1 Tax=Helicobacter sp. 16-1353 TaxID=2004996 RepID=UPI000DCB7CF7|nr:tRNA lysidine(34) synthetase TilS [Helicobacter sp. 16-1353]RAX54448.1 tRNA lysidine(34) synthetase TilS [Helicobacter sp. 16-1353]
MGKRLIGSKKFNLFGLEALTNGRNLLGFSAGVDSTCLFFLLLNSNIDFDIAIVDYGIRAESKSEIAYAKKLAKKYKKQIFISKAPKFKNNFEANARAFRFDFFAKIILESNYQNLILAHQLNDRFEWFLMQFAKGAGLNSLLGFDYITKNVDFNIIRPLYNTKRADILAFLKKNKIKYFVDKSNKNQAFLRNYFRKHYANRFIKDFEKGVIKSFHLLKNDYQAIYGNVFVYNVANIFICKKDSALLNLYNIDICVKKLGYVVSSKQRDEILKSRYSCVVASKFIIDCNDRFIFITKDSARFSHDKQIRNILRLHSIPPKIRPFVDLNLLEEIKNIVDKT